MDTNEVMTNPKAQSGQGLTLSLDFDGVLHSYASGWRGARNIPDPPVDGAITFLISAIHYGFNVVIHSSRSRYWGGRRAMKRWLQSAIEDWHWQQRACNGDLAKHYTGEDWCQHFSLKAWSIIRRIGFPLLKPPAHITIDDRAITFTGIFPSLEWIARFKPWNRQDPSVKREFGHVIIPCYEDRPEAVQQRERDVIVSYLRGHAEESPDDGTRTTLTWAADHIESGDHTTNE